MSTKRLQPVSSEWLRGLEELSEYLRGLDPRTIQTHLISQGLKSRATVGTVVYYHKKDVDNFLVKQSNKRIKNER